MKLIDLTGKKFNRLTVVERFGSDKWKRPIWKCICDCGNETMVKSNYLVNKDTKSCGCLHKEMAKIKGKNNITHGLSKHLLYKVHSGMIKRCYNEKSDNYKYYGGRGIKVCNEWLNNFVSFYEWSLNNGYQEGLQIDRIDNDGDYCPENCKFSTRKEQANNKRNNNKIVQQYSKNMELIKEYESIRGAARETGIDASSISRCCKNKSKSVNGYVWKYKTNDKYLYL